MLSRPTSVRRPRTPHSGTVRLAVLTAILAAVRPAVAQPPCAEDRAQADFAQGASFSGVSLSLTGDGEVILTPALGSEFPGSSLSSDWADFPWGVGGGSIVGGGVITVDGSRVNSVPPPGFGPGTSVEFVATFSATPFQHVGFGGGNGLAPGEIFTTSPWAIFSTRASGTQLFASIWGPGPVSDTPLPSVALGVPHRFRIDWQAATVEFHVDGVLLHSEPVALTGPMRPALSDFNVGGAVLVADWMRISPYGSPGILESRPLDAGANTAWGPMTWSDDLPAGTSLGMEVRVGNTASPDLS